jgi:2-C-methyl-D-erythritol 2,4-cyclodiphosphate synthase
VSFEYRTGLGWDNHRTIAGRPLMIGGVEIASSFGLEGHSDADILLHALTDALLGALCLGDIGQHFPDTDPRWKGAASARFLEHARALAQEQGFEVIHADCTVILERPKLKDYREPIRESVAACLRLPADRVNVKFKTAERVGPVGEGLSAEAQAVVTVRRPDLPDRV